MPCGLEYLGTHQIPLIEESLDTSFSTISISGPFSVIGMLIISIPISSVILKCLSYPGTGQRNLTLSRWHQGVLPIIPKSIADDTQSYMMLRLALPHTNTFSLGTLKKSPISCLASGIPSIIP